MSDTENLSENMTESEMREAIMQHVGINDRQEQLDRETRGSDVLLGYGADTVRYGWEFLEDDAWGRVL